MPLLELGEAFDTGIKEVDDQHRTLAAVLNNFLAARRRGEGRNALNAILGQLKSYADIHFLTEEDYMSHFAYPAKDREEHLARHDEFRMGVEEFEVDFLTSETQDLPDRVAEFVTGWLSGHIVEYDQPFCQFIMRKLSEEMSGKPN